VAVPPHPALTSPRASLNSQHQSVSRPLTATPQEAPMYFSMQPLISLIAGILILVMPRLLNYIVAIYLIILGILGLTHGRM
jgi:hypothetical protein